MQSSLQFACSLTDKSLKHILEFGVYQGRTISHIRSVFPLDTKVFGFDSFEGLPEDWLNTPCKKGAFNSYGLIPNIPNVHFYKGWFKDTLPEYIKVADKIALLHIDCDLYSSTKEVFNSINSYIVPNTIIVFDEWIYNSDPSCNDHEQKAFYEWVNQYNRSFSFIDYNDETTCGVERKIVRILS